jgi:ribosomal protein S18 acetylase RimI-like enzyme
MTDQVTFREALEGDKDAVIALIQGLNEDAMRFEPCLAGREAAEAYYNEIMPTIAAQNGFVVLAESNGQAVGCVAAKIEQDDVSIVPADRPLGYVSELFVVEAWRSRGIGGALLDLCEQRFRAIGIRRMIVSVAARNERAGSLYRRFGFGSHVELLLKRIDG